MFLDHNMKLCKMIEIYLKYDNMHIIGVINDFICINNHVNSCINSMLSVNPFEGIEPIACKWLFTMKIVVDKWVDTFKASSIVQGYHQMQEVDYDKGFH